MPNWEKVGGDDLSPTWDFKDPEHKEFIGKFVETKEIKKDDGKTSLLHEFDTDSGPMAIWGSFIIDERLSSTVPGTLCKIVYLGKEKSKKSPGQTYHNFEFYRDLDSVKEEEIPEVDLDSLATEEVTDEDIAEAAEEIK